MEFKEVLKQTRKEKELTQHQVAELLNVIDSCYANWEQGRNQPDIISIKKLATIFDVTTDYLLGIDDNIAYTNSGNNNTINGNGNNINSSIKHVVNGSSILSKDEQELIENFRKLSKDKQQSILNLTK